MLSKRIYQITLDSFLWTEHLRSLKETIALEWPKEEENANKEAIKMENHPREEFKSKITQLLEKYQILNEYWIEVLIREIFMLLGSKNIFS